jgi:hypothetical protein
MISNDTIKAQITFILYCYILCEFAITILKGIGTFSIQKCAKHNCKAGADIALLSGKSV